VDSIVLSRRAVGDLRRIGPGPELDRLQAGLERLNDGDPNLDVKPLTVAAPWRRLRIGDWRVLYRPAGDRILVARIIHRSDLQRVIKTLE
jgi:mRNA-degrading endonuclease RelE of RelBE toxin-antitoxin system